MDVCSLELPNDQVPYEGFAKSCMLEMDCQAQDHNKLLKCSQCDKVFTKKSSIVCHMRLHTGEKPFACTQCSSTFAHKSTLLHHLRLHTGEKPYECEICLKRFRQRSNYSLHKKIHTNEKSFECEICSKKFAQRVHLTTHKRLHTGEKPYVCKECNRRFSQKCHFTRHQTVHHGDKVYDCDICDKKFSCSSHLKSHLKIHTGYQQQQPKKSAFNRLVKEYGFNQSLSRNRTNEAKKKGNLECEFCHKRCIKKSHLRHHIFIHIGEKPYECKKCKKKFSEKGSLTRHMKVHGDIRPSSVPLTGDIIKNKSRSESMYIATFASESAPDMHHRNHTTEVMPQKIENKFENINKPDLACSRGAGRYLTSLTRLDAVNVNETERIVPLAEKRRKILSTVLVNKTCSKSVTKEGTMGQHLHMKPVGQQFKESICQHLHEEPVGQQCKEPVWHCLPKEPVGQQCEELVGQCLHGEPVGQQFKEPVGQHLHEEPVGQQCVESVGQRLHEEPVGQQCVESVGQRLHGEPVGQQCEEPVEQCLHEEPVIARDTCSEQEQILTNEHKITKHIVTDTILNIEHLKTASKSNEYESEGIKVTKYAKTVGESVGYSDVVNSKLKVTKQCSCVRKHSFRHKYFNIDECDSRYLSVQHMEGDRRCLYLCNNVAPRKPLISEITVLSSECLTSEKPLVSDELLSLLTELPDASGYSLLSEELVTSSESLPKDDDIDLKKCLPSEHEPTSSFQRARVQDHAADRQENGGSEVTPDRQAKGSDWSPSTKVIGVSMFLFGQQVKEECGSCEVGIKQEVDVGDETFDDPRPTPPTQIMSPLNTNP